MEWHEGRTCEEIDEQTAEAKKAEKEANEAYLAANTKTCPKKKCGRLIEKNGGCQHMTCELFVLDQSRPGAISLVRAHGLSPLLTLGDLKIY